MGWREAAVRWLGYEVADVPRGTSAVPEEVAEVRRGTSAVREEVTRDDDVGWRFLVAPRGVAGAEHDLSDWRELLEEAYGAYCTNPLAYAVIEQSVNFVLGGGAHVVAADKRAQR